MGNQSNPNGSLDTEDLLGRWSFGRRIQASECESEVMFAAAVPFKEPVRCVLGSRRSPKTRSPAGTRGLPSRFAVPRSASRGATRFGST